MSPTQKDIITATEKQVIDVFLNKIPNFPLDRVIKYPAFFELSPNKSCDNCHSTMSYKWFFRIVCDNGECYNSDKSYKDLKNKFAL